MSLSNRDELQLQRYLDGELPPDDAAAFTARLTAEPALRRRHDDARALRAGFAAARSDGRRAPAGFTANVLAAARRLPTREEMQQLDVAAGGASLCRRILLAAAVLFALGLLWRSGLVTESSPDTLQATPADVQREIERLDELVKTDARAR
jgi:anti-sigma factor RsiW